MARRYRSRVSSRRSGPPATPLTGGDREPPATKEEQRMHPRYRILVLGASYGSLLAAKFMLASHDVRLVCLPAEAQLINGEGFRVRLPVKGRSGLVEVDSR